MKPTVAVLIDGGFFLKRYTSLYNGALTHTPEAIARNIYRAALKHVAPDHDLYRIFYYDCVPFGKMAHNPISKKAIDFSKTAIYNQRLALFEELKKKRKLALRLGHIKNSGSCSGDEDFVPASKLARREGVDFILDPLWNHIDARLFEHIDGLNSTSPKPQNSKS